MGSQHPEYERHVDNDGVTRIQRKRTGSGMWIVGLGLGFTIVCLLLSAWLVASPAPVPTTPEPEPVRLAQGAPAPSPTPSRPAPKAAPRPQNVPAQPSEPAPQEEPVVQDAAPSGPAEGINLYRPGTSPLKQGIIVPENFELPPGFVRHYQSTDNGEGIKPILMFHPDYKPVDSKGAPVELPSNRVVPPELAPRGMPIEILELPEGPEGVEPIP
ncbi:hypothetical protein ATI61_101569 [Archangium gephyra]|uniref:Uncharacterized protein n=1 Tax=Archangium gephyra TaxID=48 RepID=A0AAC8QB08_9BACT|nr:hypothetical protein [Archangium gephyra]AKJ04338.1 Hypothetical protein AA314_05964 [Archangium gephyra]REG37583.1 hypothetical protein ATI61_101569 [Archangium gephyra]